MAASNARLVPKAPTKTLSGMHHAQLVLQASIKIILVNLHAKTAPELKHRSEAQGEKTTVSATSVGIWTRLKLAQNAPLEHTKR